MFDERRGVQAWLSAGDCQVQSARRTEDVVAVVVGLLHDVHLDALVVRGRGHRGGGGVEGGGAK